MKVKQRVEKLEQLGRKGKPDIVAAAKAAFRDGGLSADQRDLAKRIVEQKGVIEFAQMYDAVALGIGPTTAGLYPKPTERRANE